MTKILPRSRLPTAPVRVLVVDDAADIRFMLRLLLEEAGMVVEDARSGTQALDRLARAPVPDAVVLDQRMPGLTGIEVARELAARGAHPPLVLFSAYLHPSLHAEATELGMTTVVKTDLPQLVEVLRAAPPAPWCAAPARGRRRRSPVASSAPCERSRCPE